MLKWHQIIVRCKCQLNTKILFARDIILVYCLCHSTPAWVSQCMRHLKNYNWKRKYAFFSVLLHQYSVAVFAIFQENYIYRPHCLCYVYYSWNSKYLLFFFSIYLSEKEFLCLSLGKWLSCWRQLSPEYQQNYEKCSLQIQIFQTWFVKLITQPLTWVCCYLPNVSAFCYK